MQYFRGENILNIPDKLIFKYSREANVQIFQMCKYLKYSRGENSLNIAGVQTKQGELMGHLKISSAVLASA